MPAHDQTIKSRGESASKQRAKTTSVKAPREVEVPELFQILVSCSDEDEQRRLYERLTAEGFDCRVVTL